MVSSIYECVTKRQVKKKAVGALVWICKCGDVFVMERDPRARVISCWNRNVWWSVCGHTPQLTVQALSPATLGRTNGERRIVLESLIIEINPSARGKWEDNIIITPQASCFYFSICLLSFRQAATIWHVVYVYVLGWLCWCACVHVRGSKYSLENPIKGDMYWFAVLFKAFWDISTDVSFSVRASGRKQTNLPLLLPSSFSLFPLFYLFSFLSVTPHQSLSYAPPPLYFFPLLIAVLLLVAMLSFVHLSVLLFSLHHESLNC